MDESTVTQGERLPMTFRTSTLPEYVEWLRAWLAAEGEPTHFYDYPWARHEWLTAERDFKLAGECGVYAVNIIVPPGIRHIEGGLGHNNLYYLDGPDEGGPDVHGGIVPVYDDGVFQLLPGIREFVEQERERERAARDKARADLQAAERWSAASDIGRWRAAQP